MTDCSLKISICIDSEVFVKGMLTTVRDMPEIRACIRTHTPQQVIRAIRCGIDILILDQNVAIEVNHCLAEAEYGPRILLVSERAHIGVDQPECMRQTCGFFPGRSSQRKLGHFLKVMLDCERRNPCETHCKACPVFSSRQPRKLPLTQRETEIFSLIGQLYSNSEIAEVLGISIKTVEAHCSNIKTRLDLGSGKALLKAAIDWVEGR